MPRNGGFLPENSQFHQLRHPKSTPAQFLGHLISTSLNSSACFNPFPLAVARLDQTQFAGRYTPQGDGGAVVHDCINQLLSRRLKQVTEPEPQGPPFSLRLNVHPSQLLNIPDGNQAATGLPRQVAELVARPLLLVCLRLFIGRHVAYLSFRLLIRHIRESKLPIPGNIPIRQMHPL